MPAAKKPVGKLQRRNKPKAPDAQIVEINTTDIPAPPAKLSTQLRDEWNTAWKSDLAAYWNKDTDLVPLRRLFSMYQRLTKYETEGDKAMLQEGSTGQITLHPLLKAADSLRAQILSLETQFGLTTMGRLKLGIALGTAQQSLEEMNRRLAGSDGDEADDDDIDPRIIDINIA